MSVALIVAAILSAALAVGHGTLGESMILRRLRREELPLTRFGGRGTTLALLRFTWHLATMLFVVSAAALGSCAGRSRTATCVGSVRFVAVSFAAFAVLGLVVVVATQPRILIRHPGWLAFVAVAVLAWTGVR